MSTGKAKDMSGRDHMGPHAGLIMMLCIILALPLTKFLRRGQLGGEGAEERRIVLAGDVPGISFFHV